MELRNIYWYLGVFLVLNGLLSFLPVLVGFYYNEPVFSFILSGIASFIAGFILLRFPRRDITFGDAMLLIAFSIMLLSLFGAIPYFMSFEGGLFDVLTDGYFESVSAYTTTGITLLPDDMLEPSFPQYHSMIFRRTLSEWLGGLGVIVLFLSILAKGGISTVYLYRLESSGNRITPSIEHTSRIILRTYLFYTLIGGILLWISGLDLFHSVVGILSILSTGGFIGNLPHFTGLPFSIDLIMMLFMIIGALPFTLHYTLLSGNIKKFFKNVEIQTFFILIPLSVLFLVIVNSINYFEFSNVIHKSLLGVVSTITTTGFSSSGVEMAGPIGVFMLIILMLIGGCSGSTAGGIKLIRVTVLFKAIQWLIKKYSLPESAVVPLKISRRVFENKELMSISLFFFIYLVIIASSSAVFIVSGIEPMNSVFLAASAQGANGITRTDVSLQPQHIKLILIFLMIAGRIEIFPVLALIGFVIKNMSRKISKGKPSREKELENRLIFIRRLRQI